MGECRNFQRTPKNHRNFFIVPSRRFGPLLKPVGSRGGYYLVLLVWAWREIRKDRVSTACVQTIWFVLLAHIAILVSVFIETFLVQLPAYSVGSQLRYIAFSIPLLFFAMAFFLDRLWTISRTSSCILFAALLLTSIGSFPLKVGPHPAFRSDLIEFAKEIHRPYVDGLRLVEEYLSSNAEDGDLVQVKFAPMLNEPLVASLGDRFRFCCVFPEAGARHVRQSVREEWGDHVWEGARADWIVSSKPSPPRVNPRRLCLGRQPGWLDSVSEPTAPRDLLALLGTAAIGQFD